MNQDTFDNFLLTHHKQTNWVMHGVLKAFAERSGIAWPEDHAEARQMLVDAGLERVPTVPFFYVGVGAWLAQAYPQYMDVVVRTGDIMKVRLDLLVFRKPTGSAKNQPNNRKYTKNAYQSSMMAFGERSKRNHVRPQYAKPLTK